MGRERFNLSIYLKDQILVFLKPAYEYPKNILPFLTKRYKMDIKKFLV